LPDAARPRLFFFPTALAFDHDLVVDLSERQHRLALLNEAFVCTQAVEQQAG
jgi:hypothetical protein